VVRGSRDPVISRTRNSVPLADGWRELVIDGAGHLPHDEAPDTVNRALIDLLTGLPRG
jgi:pimeloyl-ACP methyl ester carboxylesterase